MKTSKDKRMLGRLKANNKRVEIMGQWTCTLLSKDNADVITATVQNMVLVRTAFRPRSKGKAYHVDQLKADCDAGRELLASIAAEAALLGQTNAWRYDCFGETDVRGVADVKAVWQQVTRWTTCERPRLR